MYKYNKKDRSIIFNDIYVKKGDKFDYMILKGFFGEAVIHHQIEHITPQPVHHKSTKFDGIYKEKTEEFIKTYTKPIVLNFNNDK